jgi:hypothetical protein
LVEYSDQKRNRERMVAIFKRAADKIGKISMFSDFNEHWYPFFVLKGVLIGVRFTKETSAINYFLISAHLSNSITSDNRDPNNALNSDMGVAWGLLCLHPNTIKPRWFCNCSDSVVFSCILFYYLYMLCSQFKNKDITGTFIEEQQSRKNAWIN